MTTFQRSNVRTFRRPSVPTLRKFYLGAAAIGLALAGQSLLQSGRDILAVSLYGLALFLLIWQFHAVTVPGRTPAAAVRLPATWRADWWWRLIPAALLLAVAGLAFWRFDVEHTTVEGWALYLAGLALVAAAFHVLDYSRDFSAVQATWTPAVAKWLLTILAVGAGMRLLWFGSLPFGTWFDEAEAGLQALRILDEPGYRPVFTDSINVTAHYLYLIVAAFEWLGVSTQSIRLVSVLMGLGTVIAGYLAGRELFGRDLGLVMAFFMAVSRWNVNFSRIGMYNISTPLFALLTAAYVLRGLRTGRWRDYGLAGLFLGLGLSFYPAFQLFVVALGIFLLLLTVGERGFLRRAWPGLLAMLIAAAVAVMPVARFAYEQPEQYFMRTRNTSLLATVAPEDRWQALADNAAKHLLMFNYRGDPNGRHNLPGEPMLDPVSAALMVLGLGMCLWQVRNPRALFLPIWLACGLLGGILSLDFEAPQSLRAIAALPAAYLMAVVPLAILGEEWRTGGGRYFAGFYRWPLGLLLAATAANNFHTYFVRQADDFAVWNAFSTPETIAARLLGELDGGAEGHVISLYHAHPTIRFLARDAPAYARVETDDRLPLPIPAGRDAALILDTERHSLFEEAQRLYPQAQFREFRPPFGGPTVIYFAYLTAEDLASIQGLAGAYFANGDWSGQPAFVQQDRTLSFDWLATPPLPEPFSVEWRGVLHADSYGPHEFHLQAPGYAELYVGEELVLQGEGSLSGAIVLAEGNHNLRMRSQAAAGPFSLAWRPPGREEEIIPQHALYVSPVRSSGLLGCYYAHGDWQTRPAGLRPQLCRIDPQLATYFHVTPLPRPYTVEWEGKLIAPVDGQYRFDLQTMDESSLWVDGALVVDNLGRTRDPQAVAGSVQLDAGLHDIRVHYADRTDHTFINLSWTPPHGMSEPVPSWAMVPPQGDYARVDLAAPAGLLANPGQPSLPAAALPDLAGQVDVVREGLGQPRGLAVGDDGRLFIADSAGGRLLIVAPDGDTLSVVSGGDSPFVEPFDVAIGPQGEVYVLDAAAGRSRVAVLDAAGARIGDVPLDSVYTDRSRGLDVDGAGRIWVANTPRGRVAAFSRDGELLAEAMAWTGAGAQPVEVVTNGQGSFVTDAGIYRLIRLDGAGLPVGSWEIPVANSLDGPHLAVDGQGRLYQTEPEEGRVVRRSPTGEVDGAWQLSGPELGTVKPVGVAVDAEGAVWVTDVLAGRLLRIQPAPRSVPEE